MSVTNYESYWPQFKALAEAGQYQEIAKITQSIQNPKEQVSLLRFAVRGLMFREWSNKTLVPIVQIGRLGNRNGPEKWGHRRSQYHLL